jgi:predicted aminopeptidase
MPEFAFNTAFRNKTWRRRIGAAVSVLLLGGCAATAYLGQSIGGEFDLLHRAQSIPNLVAAQQTPPELRVRLQAVLRIREFATRELSLPDNGSYRRYTDVGRKFVVWNVFVAPELSSDLMSWCFPVAGCVAYRGYFREADAEAFATTMRNQGYDVFVGGVPAYSTLGYFDDPVLSTFIQYSDAEIARLLFHELAHQVAYAKDDSTFNESFAVAVETEGLRRYLAAAPPARVEAVNEATTRREEFAELVSHARERLVAAYAAARDDAARREAKARIVDDLQQAYAALKNGKWHGYSGYDNWFAGGVNNAKLGSVAVYTARVPQFQALLARNGGKLAAFYEEVKALSRTPKGQRDSELDRLTAPLQAAAE